MVKLYDEIRIENLECFAYHGVHPHENENGQYFYVNAVFYIDTRPPGLSDDLDMTVDYGKAARFINNFMSQNTYKLIEAAAERMAAEILLNFPLIMKIDLEIRKPNAPIELNFSSVSVKISREWHKVYIATGSNLGESENLLKDAAKKLRSHAQIRDLQESKLIKSTPYGKMGQPDFLNGAMCFWTLLSPEELLGLLHEIEEKAGRVRVAVSEKTEENHLRWGARTLDLDILFYGEVVMAAKKLTIPHPDLHNRDFVLAPLAELNPHLIHPVLNKSIRQLLSEVSEPCIPGTQDLSPV